LQSLAELCRSSAVRRASTIAQKSDAPDLSGLLRVRDARAGKDANSYGANERASFHCSISSRTNIGPAILRLAKGRYRDQRTVSFSRWSPEKNGTASTVAAMVAPAERGVANG